MLSCIQFISWTKSFFLTSEWLSCSFAVYQCHVRWWLRNILQSTSHRNDCEIPKIHEKLKNNYRTFLSLFAGECIDMTEKFCSIDGPTFWRGMKNATPNISSLHIFPEAVLFNRIYKYEALSTQWWKTCKRICRELRQIADCIFHFMLRLSTKRINIDELAGY